jgi:hypothetical protein
MRSNETSIACHFFRALRLIPSLSRELNRAGFVGLSFLCILLPSDAMANLVVGDLPSGGRQFEISTEAGNTFGTAVEFTPLQNVDFGNVTLWLSGYTGLNGSSLVLSLMQDTSAEGLPFSGPGAAMATGSAAANNGSDAAFTFNLGGQLKASTPYWLFLYLQVPGGGVGPGYGQFNCYWDGGGAPVGDGVIDGSESFADGFYPSSLQSAAPAFSLNSVPELTSTALLLALAIGGCLLSRHHWRQD